MGLSKEIVSRACERVFERVCEVGRGLEAGTPAAGFTAAAARKVGEAQEVLAGDRPEDDDLTDVARLLARASALLGDVGRMSEGEVDGLERVSVIVDGLCVTIEMDQHQAAKSADADGDK